MKRILFMLSVVVCVLVLFTGFNFTKRTERKEVKSCKGYVVIEAGKGLDCNGDTIRLTKRYGYFEIASTPKKKATI
jgi:hypothetical protein